MSYFTPLYLRFSPPVDKYINYQLQSETKILSRERVDTNIIYFNVSMLAYVEQLSVHRIELKFGEIHHFGLDKQIAFIKCFHHVIRDMVLRVNNSGVVESIVNLSDLKNKWLSIRDAVIEKFSSANERKIIIKFNDCINDVTGEHLLNELKNKGIFRILFSDIYQRITEPITNLKPVSIFNFIHGKSIMLDQILTVKQRKSFGNTCILNLTEDCISIPKIGYTGELEIEIDEYSSTILSANYNQKLNKNGLAIMSKTILKNISEELGPVDRIKNQC